MSLLQDNSLYDLLKKQYFSSSDFDLLEFLDENIALSTVETAITDINVIVKTLSDHLPTALTLSKQIVSLQTEKKSLEIKTRIFSWLEVFMVLILMSIGATILFATGITENVSPRLNFLLSGVAWIIVLSIVFNSYRKKYKQSKHAAGLLPETINKLNTAMSQLVRLKQIMLVDKVLEGPIICINLSILLNFLNKLKIILTDQKISETGRLLAIEQLFYHLKKIRNDKIILAATLATATYSKRQAAAAERQALAAEATQTAIAQQTAALEEQNKKLEQQTQVIKDKARLDESRRQNGEPWHFQ